MTPCSVNAPLREAVTRPAGSNRGTEINVVAVPVASVGARLDVGPTDRWIEYPVLRSSSCPEGRNDKSKKLEKEFGIPDCFSDCSQLAFDAGTATRYDRGRVAVKGRWGMELSLRPYVTAGVVVAGAGLIVAAPLGPSAVQIQTRAVQLTAVEGLAADMVGAAAAPQEYPVSTLADVFTNAFANLQSLGSEFSGNLTPILTASYRQHGDLHPRSPNRGRGGRHQRSECPARLPDRHLKCVERSGLWRRFRRRNQHLPLPNADAAERCPVHWRTASSKSCGRWRTTCPTCSAGPETRYDAVG